MGYRFKVDETVQEGVARITREQVKKSLRSLDEREFDDAVHDVRKRCKKIRALIRITRPEFEKTYDRVNTRLRDAARRISDLRDSTSLIESVDGLIDRYQDETDTDDLTRVRTVLTERRDEVSNEQDIGGRIVEVREALIAVRSEADEWRLQNADDFKAVSGGLQKTYRRGRRAMRDAVRQPTDERLHEWRKRVKYNRYQTRVLTPCWPDVLQITLAETKRLSDLLGDDHDLAVLRKAMIDEPGRFGSVEEVQPVLLLIDARRRELQSWAFGLGRRVFAERPEPYVKRVRSYWKAWKADASLVSLLGEMSQRTHS